MGLAHDHRFRDCLPDTATAESSAASRNDAVIFHAARRRKVLVMNRGSVAIKPIKQFGVCHKFLLFPGIRCSGLRGFAPGARKAMSPSGFGSPQPMRLGTPQKASLSGVAACLPRLRQSGRGMPFGNPMPHFRKDCARSRWSRPWLCTVSGV